jgi:hypothetical protein
MDHYANFKDLVNDLYKLYKVRLWMSAVNPASFSTNAINHWLVSDLALSLLTLCVLWTSTTLTPWCAAPTEILAARS